MTAISGHIRRAFREWIDLGFPEEGIAVSRLRVVGVDLLLETLEHSEDRLPERYCVTLGIPKGSTYAVAVRAVRVDRGELVQWGNV